MGTGALRRDQIVHIDGAQYRLLRMITDTRWQLEQLNTLHVREFEINELLRLIVDKRLAFPNEINALVVGPPGSESSEGIAEIIKIRRMYAKAAMGVPNTRKKLEQVIDEVWNQIRLPQPKPGYVTVYRWKRRFSQSGGDYRILADHTQLKGNRKSRFKPEVISLCRQAIAEKYMRREGCSIQKTLDHALHMVQRENRLLPKGLQFEGLPTRRLIKRLIEEIPAFDLLSARKGFNTAQRVFRSVRGHIVAQAPLERAEIDHTVLDLIVLDDKTGEPAGRPSVTACIDVYSRCILGIYVGFIPPSEQSIAKCLKDCLRPKVTLQEEYPGINNEWRAHGKMHELVVDNGFEFHSNRLERVCCSLNIDLNFSPRRQAWFKGHIERFFRTLNEFVHEIPGTTFSNLVEKGDYNPDKKASLTLSQVRYFIRKWIADYYHQSIHSVIQTTPAQMWASGIHQADIELPDESDQLDVIMAKVDRRVLTHSGIEYKGLFYNSPELAALRMREGERIEVEIRIDEEDIGSIYVVRPKTSQVYSVPAINFEYASGISLHQHKLNTERRRESGIGDHSSADCQTAKEEIDLEIQRDSRLNRRKTRKHAARQREESDQARVKANARKNNEGTLRTEHTMSAEDSLGGSEFAEEFQRIGPVTVAGSESTQSEYEVIERKS